MSTMSTETEAARRKCCATVGGEHHEPACEAAWRSSRDFPPIQHVAADPVVHDGPGHRFADPSWCGGCWWEQIGCRQPPDQHSVPHAANCPACAKEPT